MRPIGGATVELSWRFSSVPQPDGACRRVSAPVSSNGQARLKSRQD